MVFSRIIDALDASQTTGAQAELAARTGFLEWALAAQDGVPSYLAARADLARVKNPESLSPAAQRFVDFLTDAARMPMSPPKRRGGRRRVLH